MMIGAISQTLLSNQFAVSQKTPAASDAAPTFSSLVENAGKEMISKFDNAESLSLAALSGQGSVREVADAVMSAEQALHIATGIRDKIVSAYLEISRMAI
jgi:flagellar hook-basal body complex protein FliE